MICAIVRADKRRTGRIEGGLVAEGTEKVRPDSTKVEDRRAVQWYTPAESLNKVVVVRGDV
jgi:hypothetical protein